MPLRSLSALAKAIDAVKREAGTNDEHKALIESLSGVSEHLGDTGATGTAATAGRDAADDDYSFATAEKRHKAATNEPAPADKADTADKPAPDEVAK